MRLVWKQNFKAQSAIDTQRLILNFHSDGFKEASVKGGVNIVSHITQLFCYYPQIVYRNTGRVSKITRRPESAKSPVVIFQHIFIIFEDKLL